MKTASTFLSHSHQDKAIVEAVARELWRRGVVVWLDQTDLAAAMGADLSEALRRAVRGQASVALFLSEAALRSAWVNDELAAALEQSDQDVLPVFLGDPPALIAAHEELKRRWLRADGRGVNINYEQFDPARPIEDEAARLAAMIARRLFDKLQFSRSRELIVCLDQRGQGDKRSDQFPVPDALAALEAPALIFRSSLRARSVGESLHGGELTGFLQAAAWAMGQAFGSSRGAARKVHLCGDAQLALPFAVGRHFDRSNNAWLYCYNSRDGVTFSNEGQSLAAPLVGGNERCEKPHAQIAPLQPGETIAEAALLILKESYLPDALGFLATHGVPDRPVWVESEAFADSQQAMRFVTDVVALLARLKREHGTKQVRLFLDLPFGVTPLLAANLLHAMDKVALMEYRRDQREYVECDV
jgi:hypothetical protein